MRNFKKLLSLVLCMAMMLSIMVVGAGAVFSDQSKIKNTEAVDMCSALNIINGYTDGSYKPEGNVTRAEMCKMICVALNGGKEPALSTSATPSFTDIGGNWAQAYIESCVAKGIVAGVGGGKFNPAGNVTASQAAKMLLIALGYNSDNEGYTGNAWEVNVNVAASAKGLYEDLEGIDVSASLSRDNAAQMIWNALNAYEVEYKSTLVSNNGQLTTQLVCEDKLVNSTSGFVKITLLEDKYESMTATGQMTKLDWNSTDKEYIYTLDSGRDFQSAQDFTDLFGMNVKVVYTVNKKTNDITVFGIVPKDAKVLATGIIDDIEYSATKEIKVDGTKYKTDDDASGLQALAFNGSNIALFTGADNDVNSALKPFYTVSVIDNDNDGKVNLVVYLPVYAAQVKSVGTKQITVQYLVGSATDNFKFEDEDIYEGVAKDDYVVVTKGANTYDGTNIVTKMDSVAGKVTALRAGKVQIDGTWYTNLSATTFRQDGTYTFYVIGSFVCYADQKGAAALTDVLYVEKFDTTNLSTQAKVYFYDGTSATITIDDVYKADGDTTATLDTGLYTYTESKGEYDLTEIDTYTNGNGVTDENLLGYKAVTTVTGITKATDNVYGKLNNTYAFADDAVVFLKYKDNGTDKVKVVSGAVARSYNTAITATGGYALYDTVNGTNKVVVALVVTDGNEPNAKGVSGNYAYVVDKPFTTKIDGTKVVGYPVWDGKQNITLYEEASTASATKGNFITFDNLGNSNVDNVTIAKNGSFALTTAAVKGIDGDTFTIYGDTTNTYIITKDTTILYVDSDEVEGVETGALQTAAESAPNVGINNIKFVIDEQDGTAPAYKLDLLVIEVNNEF